MDTDRTNSKPSIIKQRITNSKTTNKNPSKSKETDIHHKEILANLPETVSNALDLRPKSINDIMDSEIENHLVVSNKPQENKYSA